MELLKKLTSANAVSGSENSVHALITKEVSPYVDEIYTDSLGNLIAHKKANGKKLMLSAHVDEIGLMANYIDENGFVRFSPVGGVDIYASLYQRVVFENGTVGVVSFENKSDVKKDLIISTMYIDIGASDKETAMKMVQPGDTAAFFGEFRKCGANIISKALDNRSGVYILIEALKKISLSPFDLYFVFTSQEEIGLKGARTAAYSIEPDAAIAVDVTSTGDTPGCETMDVSIGKGAAIKIMDKSLIAHKSVREGMQRCARKNCIPFQHEILSYGGTDAGAMQTSKGGCLTGAVSLPVRYVHTPCEMADENDINACISLVAELCKVDHFFER